MQTTAPTQPFRWDVTRRERLGSLVASREAEAHLCGVVEQCAASVLARSGDARCLYFVGRSPASIFDLLSGALAHTTWRDRLTLLPFSMRSDDERRDVLARPSLTRQLEANLASVGLHPRQLQRGRGVVAFVDLVAEGGTFGNLLFFRRRWARAEEAQWDVIRRKPRFVAITQRGWASPTEWRCTSTSTGSTPSPAPASCTCRSSAGTGTTTPTGRTR